MAKTFFISLLLFNRFFAFSQTTERFVYPDAFYFVKEINLHPYAGKQFRCEVYVKTIPADSLSKPRVYAIQARDGKEDFIGKTMTYASASDDDWKKYSLTGMVDAEAKRLWFYCAVNGNGNFYFDQIIVSIEENAGNWKALLIENASFEEDKNILKGYFFTRKKSNDCTIAVSKEIFFEGKQSLHINSSGQKASVK